MAIKDLNEQVIELQHANTELMDKIQQHEGRTQVTYKDGKYTDDVQACIMELLSHNVGILHVQLVIHSILKMAGVECNKLSQHTAISDMMIEARALSQMQLAEVLTQENDNTLHTDGTTKFGHKYSSYQVSTKDTTYSLGLRETASGSAVMILEILKSITLIKLPNAKIQLVLKLETRFLAELKVRCQTEQAQKSHSMSYCNNTAKRFYLQWSKLVCYVRT